MKNMTAWVAKAAGVWVSLFAFDMLMNVLTPAMTAGSANDPLGYLPASALVSGAFALLLAALAVRMPLPFWRKVATLFVVFYLANSLLSEIEAFFFNDSLHMTPMAFIAMASDGVGKAGVAALTCAILWRTESFEPPPPLRGLVWKVPLIVVLYMMFYIVAGACVMASKVVQAYYSHGLHIDMTILLGLQVARGAIWTGLAYMLVRSLDASNMAKALLTGLSFAVFMSLVLLYPNALMPWDVRKMHLLEIFGSNLLFGLTAARILLAGARRTG